MKIIRPTFPDKGFQNLFLQIDGTAFDGWTTGRRLPTIWKKSGVQPDLRVTATDVRQWLVTNVHEKKTQGASFDDSDLRRTMCHSNKTAKRYYLRGELTEVADWGLDIIIEYTPDLKPLLCIEVGDKGQVEEQADQQGEEGQAVPIGDEGNNPDQEDEAEWAGPTCTQEKPEGPGGPQQCDLAEEKASTKRPLTRTEKAIISEVFPDLIGSTDRVEIEEVRHELRKTVQLRPLLEITGMDIKVADRIRHCQTSSADANSEPPVDLPPMALPDKEQLTREWTEAASSSIISPTVNSTKRTWEVEDSRAIEEFFRKIDKCPKKQPSMKTQP